MRRFLSSLPVAAVLAAAAFAYDAAATPSTALACTADPGDRCPDKLEGKDNKHEYSKVKDSERDATVCTSVTTSTGAEGSGSMGPVSGGVELQNTTTTEITTTYRIATYQDKDGDRRVVNCDTYQIIRT